MKSDRWLEQYYGGEFFSGNFNHLPKVINDVLLFDQSQFKIATIAGTNGKGQTTRILSSMLDKSDQSYMSFTSPHLNSVLERFVFNGKPLDDEIVLLEFQELSKKLKNISPQLSYYEFLFMSFLSIAQKVNPSILLLEVGLGGRLDATNCIDADVCAVTSISRDHQEYLGERYEDILFEKLGIAKNGCELITNFNLQYLNNKTVKILSARSLVKWTNIYKPGQDKQNFSIQNFNLSKTIFKKLLPAVTVPIVEHKKIAIRRQMMHSGCEFDFYPSHNLDGIRKLVQFLDYEVYNNSYSQCFMGFSDRDLDELISMTSLMQSFIDKDNLYFFSYEHGKSISEDKLHKLAEKTGVKVVTNRSNIIKEVVSQNIGSVLVTGSNYFIADFYHYLKSVGTK